MQIVRNLAGYTLGRSDLVRRAMSKKKAAVMEKERQTLFMEMKQRAFRAVLQMVFLSRLQTRSTMR